MTMLELIAVIFVISSIAFHLYLFSFGKASLRIFIPMVLALVVLIAGLTGRFELKDAVLIGLIIHIIFTGLLFLIFLMSEET